MTQKQWTFFFQFHIIVISALFSILYYSKYPLQNVFLFDASFVLSLLTHIAFLFVLITGVFYLLKKLFALLGLSIKPLFGGVFMGIFCAWLLADFFIYRAVGFHLTLITLKFFFLEGGIGNANLSIWEHILIPVITGLILSLELIFIYFIKNTQKIFKIPHLVKLIFLLVFFEKFIYSYVYYTYRQTGLHFTSDVLPFYNVFQITANSKMKKWNFPVKKEGITNAPVQKNKYTQKLVFSNESFKNYNYVWIILDCFRYESFGENTAPHTWNFSKKSYNFTNHISGGNHTVDGMFSLFYGVYSSHRSFFYGQKIYPPWVTALIKRNYHMIIKTSEEELFARWDFFTKGMPPESLDASFFSNYSKNIFLKDQKAFAEFNLALKKAAKSQKPFFATTFINSTHYPYTYPEKDSRISPPFQPTSKINTPTIFLSKKEVRQNLKNRYLNSLFFADIMIKSVLDTLEFTGLMKNTVIIITGDHGEEFLESNFMFHGHAFSTQQTHVPFIMKIPETKPMTFSHPTAHYDVLPSLFHFLGVKNWNQFSSGNLIWKDTERSYPVSCKSKRCAVFLENFTYVVNLDVGTSQLFHRLTYKPADINLLTTKHKAAIRKALGEMRRFK